MIYKNIQKQINNFFTSLLIVICILGSLSVLTLTKTTVGDSIIASASPVCPSGYTINNLNTLCIQTQSYLFKCFSGGLPNGSGNCSAQQNALFDCNNNIAGQTLVFTAGSGYTFCTMTPQYFALGGCYVEAFANINNSEGIYGRGSILDTIMNYENRVGSPGYATGQFLSDNFCSPSDIILETYSGVNGCPANFRPLLERARINHIYGAMYFLNSNPNTPRLSYHDYLCVNKSFMNGSLLHSSPPPIKVVHGGIGTSPVADRFCGSFGDSHNLKIGDTYDSNPSHLERTNLCGVNTYSASVPYCNSGFTIDYVNSNCFKAVSPTSFTCPAGQYLTNQATDSCAPCPAGSYCTGGVGAVSVTCSAGNYCLAGVSSQTPCPAGSYCASVSQAPVACSAGNYCPALATTQTQCPVNNYCLAGASSPTPCPANYSSPAGSSSLSACIPNNTTLSLKLNLSSVFTDSTDTLGCDLRTRDLLPTTQPYNNPTYNYTGTEVLPNSNLATDICDWILITLSDSTTNNVVATKAALVKTNGTVIDAINATTSNTTTGVNFSTLTPANYKVTIRHRNHLGISTNTPVAFTPASTTTIDFTTNTNVKGSNQAEVGIVGPTNTTYNASALPGAVGSKIYALRQADSNNNGQVDAADRTLLSNSQEYDGVYDNKDLNLDGSIDASDRAITQLAPEASENL